MSNLFSHNIKQRTFIAAPPEKVYDTITNASEWDQFFTTGMTLDPKPGGKCVFRWKDWGPDFYTVEADGDVIEAVRPRRFVFQWYPIGRENPTTVSFRLEAEHGGTVLTVEESGYPDTDKGRAMILECAAGWGEAATLLKFYVEYGAVPKPPEKGQ
jgi:uncharacterized protein YndB with AHSA1/START domain